MVWWQWLAFGLLWLALELVFPNGFFLFMIGIAALVVGGFVYLQHVLGSAAPYETGYSNLILGPAAQWFLFGILAVAFSLFFAKRLQKYFIREGSQDATSPIGATIQIRSIITPGNVGEAELWGSPWRVRNKGNSVLEVGSTRKVIAVEGVTLEVGDE